MRLFVQGVVVALFAVTLTAYLAQDSWASFSTLHRSSLSAKASKSSASKSHEKDRSSCPDDGGDDTGGDTGDDESGETDGNSSASHSKAKSAHETSESCLKKDQTEWHSKGDKSDCPQHDDPEDGGSEDDNEEGGDGKSNNEENSAAEMAALKVLRNIPGSPSATTAESGSDDDNGCPPSETPVESLLSSAALTSHDSLLASPSTIDDASDTTSLSLALADSSYVPLALGLSSTAAVPEPGSCILALLGVATLGGREILRHRRGVA